MSKLENNSEVEKENLTQVRSIIQQINEGKPSHSKKREVVVRADGSKAVRVTKKRRVLMTEKEISHRNRKHVVAFIATLFLIVCALITYFLIQMASMSGEEYLQSRVDELKKAWGAESVRVIGSGISGTTLHISSIVAEFPADSLLEQVELSDVTAELSSESFFREKVHSEALKIKRANFILRAETELMNVPLLNGNAFWRFNRMECEDFSVSWGRGESVRLSLKNSAAHLYYPRSGREDCVVAMKGGSLLVKNWQTVYVSEAKAHLSPIALEDLYIAGSVEVPSESAESKRSSLILRHRIANGERMDGDVRMSTWNMPFSDFTKGRFETFFSARTTSRKASDLQSRVIFTEEGPVFHGEFVLSKIMLTSFPAITAMIEHVEPFKRRQYLPPTIDQGIVTLSVKDGEMSLSLTDSRVMTRDRLALKGNITVKPTNELSGTLSYGLPGILTRAEYTDGLPDPIFEDKGDWTWLSTTLKGFANMPDDNMAEIEARAVELRKSRPARVKFDVLDVNKLSEQLRAEEQTQGNDATPAGSGNKGLDSLDPFAEPSATDDPFAPLAPF